MCLTIPSIRLIIIHTTYLLTSRNIYIYNINTIIC